MPIFGIASLLASVASFASAVQLNLKSEFGGSSFFDGFYYNESLIDPFNYGNIHYVSQEDAQSNGLTYVNDAGHAILKVDNTTDGTNDETFGRDTVMIISNDALELGDLVVMDAVHVPWGCSVWPAFWTLDDEFHESRAGEIDIFESVNAVTQGQYTLHTDDGCNQANTTGMTYDDSTLVSTNCYYKANGNQGCGYTDDRDGSAGQPFAQNGGGVHAMLYDGQGIRIWFFPRNEIPGDLTSGHPDPDTWNDAQGVWPAAGCNPDSFFSNQHLILNINICGSYAGDASVFSQTCSGVCTDLVGDPTNYDNAYFEISSIRVYNGATTEVATQAFESAQNTGPDAGRMENHTSSASYISGLSTGFTLAVLVAAVL